MSSRIAAAAFGVLLVVLTPLVAPAQPLADRVPGDAMLYLGWTGSESMGEGYEGSHLKAVVDASNVAELFEEFLPRVFERIAQEQPDMAEAHQLLSAIGGPMWRRPSALFFAGVDFEAKPVPFPRAALICQAGVDADAMEKRLKQVVAKLPEDVPVPVRVSREDDLVILSVGYAKAEPIVAVEGKSLSTNDDFKSALANVHTENALAALYVDFKAAMGLADQGIARFGDPDAKEMWPQLRTALGLDGLERAVWTEAFEGKEWGSRAFLAARGPRKGLLALLDAEPISDEMLKVVPESSTLVGLFRFDLAKLVSEAKSVVREIDPRAADQMDEALGEVSSQIGIDIEKDILAPLGDEWAYYVDPMSGGRGLLGLVVVNRPRDAEKTEQTLGKAKDLLNDFIAEQMSDADVQVQFAETKVGDLTINYLAIPIVTPGWAVKDGNLYFGLFPQTIASAAEQVSSGSRSIVDNKEFAALRKELGGERATAIQYIDLPETTPDAYTGWLMISRLVGFGDLFGVQSPAIVLPPLKTLLQHMTPAATFTWVEDDGWHMHTRAPFPGSTLFASDPLGGIGGGNPAMWLSYFGAMGRATSHEFEMDQHANTLPPAEARFGTNRQYYTTDDGKTYFADSADKLPPFKTDEGKTAYRARVFQCGDDGEPFVHHLERYSEEEKRRILDAQEKIKLGAPQKAGEGVAFLGGMMGGVEVKKPGDKTWVKMTPQTMEEFQKVMTPACPDGSNDIRVVLPEE